MFRDIAAAHPPATQLVLATLIGSPGRDWWLTMLTDAQVAAQAFDFRAETHLGIAAEAFALVGALEV